MKKPVRKYPNNLKLENKNCFSNTQPLSAFLTAAGCEKSISFSFNPPDWGPKNFFYWSMLTTSAKFNKVRS